MQSKTRSKTRYIHKQKHKYTCAAVALANAFRKLGKNVTYGEALKMFGGLKKFSVSKRKPYGGMSNKKIEQVAKENGLNVETYHLTYEECVLLSSLKNVAIAVAYGVPQKKKVYGHIVTLNRRGKALNGGKVGLTPLHWKITHAAWGFEPIVFILTRKK